MTARGLSRLLPSLVVFAALLAAWQAAGPLFGVREYLLPGPLAVAQALGNFSIPWQTHLRVTTLEILGGFALAGAGGEIGRASCREREEIQVGAVSFAEEDAR